MNNIIDFYNSTLANGGASFNAITKELNPSGGFFVSIPQYERKVALNEFTRFSIEHYIHDNLEVVTEKNYIGTWINNDYVCLDISERILDKRIALERAYKHNQLAVYDANNDTIIDLPTPQRSGSYTQQRAYLTSVINNLLAQNK